MDFEPVLPSSTRIASMEGFSPRLNRVSRALDTSALLMPPLAIILLSVYFVLYYIPCIYILFYALLVGNEGKGLSSLLSRTVDTMVTIPMKKSVESFNVSVATGITLFEISKCL